MTLSGNTGCAPAVGGIPVTCRVEQHVVFCYSVMARRNQRTGTTHCDREEACLGADYLDIISQ